MDNITKILAFREGGQTTRCHVRPFIGPYNVAIHSYNALSLLFVLCPKKPSLQLIKAILFHDVPERWTGDVPTTAKLASSELKQALDDLEEQVLIGLGIGGLVKDLTKEEKIWLKAVDLLELFLWGKEQEAFGNTTVSEMNIRIQGLILNNLNFPKQIREIAQNFKFKRTAEARELIGE